MTGLTDASRLDRTLKILSDNFDRRITVIDVLSIL